MSGPARDAPVVVIGAGPAGLTAAYELAVRGVPVTLLEQEEHLGGLARTVAYKGFRFDLGGHRFFTKVERVRRLWQTVLGDDLLVRPRLSRILYHGRYFDYPLRPRNALQNLGLVESALVALSYLRVRVAPIADEDNLEDWLSNRFGRRLFRTFFQSYTEKVWGLPCTAISAAWAAQRIRGLSLQTALLNMLVPRRRGAALRTLTDEFLYPRLGPGMMWDALRRTIEAHGGRILLGHRVTRLRHEAGRVTAVETSGPAGTAVHAAAHVIAAMPLGELARALDPPAAPALLAAADTLRYRDFLTVAVIVDEAEVFPDNWLYVHDESVRVGRIQNFKNWSPELVPDQSQTCLGLEYFCFAGDDLWASPDEALVARARRELERLGLVSPATIRDAVVVRMRRAYPIYSAGYRDALAVLRAALRPLRNLQVVGRNGMHRYNNLDHSMLTALLAVDNIFGERHDLWQVNTDDEYHEAGAAGG